MKYWIITFSLFLLFCMNKSSSENALGETKQSSSTVFGYKNHAKLPDNLISQIYTNGHTIPTIDLFEKDWIKYIDTLEQTNPIFCTGDFTGNGKKDFAVILTTGKNKYCLFTYNLEDNKFEEHKIRCFENTGKGIRILPKLSKKGIYETIDGPVEFKNDFISLELIDESLTISYLWKDSIYIKFLWN